jgi:hypothetical protein
MFACSSFETADPSEPAVTSDGGDGGANEDATLADGGRPDAPPPGDADVRFCAAHPASALCDDFDDGELSGWTPDLKGSGQIILDGGGKSAPHAVLFTAGASDNTAHARIQRDIGAKPNLVCTFELYYDVDNADGYEVARFDIKGDKIMTVVLTSDAIKRLSFADAGVASTATAILPSAIWTAVTLTIDVASSKATVTWPGAPSLYEVDLTGIPAPTKYGISFGLQYLPNGLTRFRIDDVVCDLQ